MSSAKLSPESVCCHHKLAQQSTPVDNVNGLTTISYSRCGNCGQVVDSFGHTVLHHAASCGFRDVTQWLISHGEGNVNLKEMDTGRTPLHTSIIHGQIHVAVNLMQLGANIMCLDQHCLSALDHAMKDRQPYVEYNLSNPCEVYTWGTNSNYTLGIGNQHGRAIPELLDTFRKQNISIKQVAMHKFHSVFVAHDGRVFSCGHGQGGRLGIDTEQAALVPCQIKLPTLPHATQVHILAASVGQDHTVLLAEGGYVWTCGLNVHHQLGHVPPPAFLLAPRALGHRYLKGMGQIKGVCAGRFHTVIWGSQGVRTCGLHAGQLGHDKAPESTQMVPRLVSALQNKDIEITSVAASDGATVVVTQRGDIYVLHEYKCRRIVSRLVNIIKVVAMGGNLDSRVDASVLMDHGGEQLKIAVLTATGRVFLWQQTSQRLLPCLFSLDRPLTVADVILSRGTQLLLTTRDGEAFEGELKRRKIINCASDEDQEEFHDFQEKREIEEINIKRLSHIHRAVSVACDPKGRNFAVIQTHPQAALLAVPTVDSSEIREQLKSLLQNVHPLDNIHDIMFVVENREFAAHKYIIASRCEPLAKIIQNHVNDTNEVPKVKISSIKADIFEQLLLYIYSNDCALLKVGVCPIQYAENNTNKASNSFNPEDFDDFENVSAYQVYKEENSNKKNKNKSNQKNINSDPLRLLHAAGKRFGLPSLCKKLDCVKYENGCIVARNIHKPLHPDKMIFDLKKHQDLYDVTVKCEDGQEIKAHKCMLAARLEYFNSMLTHGWLESSQNSMLRLPIPYDVLEILLAFLYSDDSDVVRKSDDLDLVSSVLVIADQFFVARLKEISEVTLASLLTLRNVAQVFQFANLYNAKQLKQCCMQYICLNLGAELESHVLEGIEESLLEELSKYYRNFNPSLLSRDVASRYLQAPSHLLIEALSEMYPGGNHNDELDTVENGMKKNAKHVKKKPRVRKISRNENKGTERTRNESVSSNLSANSDEGDGKCTVSFEDLSEQPQVQDVTLNLTKLQVSDQQSTPNAPWVRVTGNSSKQQKIIQARLKAVCAAKESLSHMQPIDNFTRLVRNPSSPQHTPHPPQLGTPPLPQKPTSALTHPSVPASPPPDLISDFPELSTSPSSHHESHFRSAHKLDIKKPVKISQKQRKKMAAEEQGDKTGQSKIAWGLPANRNSNSFVDIMREEQQTHRSSPITVPIQLQACSSRLQNSPTIANVWQKAQASPVGSPDTVVNFCDIVADEKKQRDNWTKMRAKPLELTQLEDKAIEDLLLFYNASGVGDERITVRRVITNVVATPIWISSHH